MFYLLEAEFPPSTSIPDTDVETATYINSGFSLPYSKAIPFDSDGKRLEFKVAYFRPYDILPSTTATDLYSQKLLDLLSELGVNFSSYPVYIQDKRSGKEICYFMLSILDISDFLDMTKTVINLRRIHLFPRKNFSTELAVFRDANKQYYIFTNDLFRVRAKELNLTGCSFHLIPESGFKLI